MLHDVPACESIALYWGKKTARTCFGNVHVHTFMISKSGNKLHTNHVLFYSKFGMSQRETAICICTFVPGIVASSLLCEVRHCDHDHQLIWGHP